MSCKVWDEITYPFPNLKFGNGYVTPPPPPYTHFIPTYFLSMLGLKLNHISKRGSLLQETYQTTLFMAYRYLNLTTIFVSLGESQTTYLKQGVPYLETLHPYILSQLKMFISTLYSDLQSRYGSSSSGVLQLDTKLLKCLLMWFVGLWSVYITYVLRSSLVNGSWLQLPLTIRETN